MEGLLDRDLKFISEAVGKYPEVEMVILFGSRAMGNHKKGSDVDLALVGDTLTRRVLLRIVDDLNEVYPLPYFFDILIYHEIDNDALRRHIDEVGLVIYRR